MHVCLIVPDLSLNIGDSVILAGVKNILFSALGKEIKLSYYSFDSPRNVLIEYPDLIVISGTPWLWHLCDVSEKYINTRTFLELYDCPKIALGLGSCFGMNGSERLVKTSKETMKNLEYFYTKFDFISTRDRFAYKIIKSLKIDTTLLDTYCPSTYAIQSSEKKISDKKHGCLIYYAPQYGISKDTFDGKFIRKINDYQYIIAKSKKLDVYCVSIKEYSHYVKFFGDNITLVDNYELLIDIVMRYDFVISGRVHFSIPFSSYGKKSYILPFDSRSSVALRSGCKYILDPRLLSIYFCSGIFYILNLIRYAKNKRMDKINEYNKVVKHISKYFV